MHQFKRPLWSLFSAVVVTAALIAATPANAGAYGAGPANWQLTIAETFTAPGTQSGFGIWGWCDLSGAANRAAPTSGNAGDCQAAIYGHAPTAAGGDVKCTESINVTSWGEAPARLGLAFGVPLDLYVFTGTQVNTPGSDPAACGPSGPLAHPIDLGPARTGHYNGEALLDFRSNLTGEIQLQVTQIP
jgi:hypothetical protein